MVDNLKEKNSWTRLWHQQGDTGRLLERKYFWHVCIFIFTLCHGQSSVERGFNINKEILVAQFERKDFWHVCIFIFTLCHGQSSIQRGYNINKETLVDNLKEKTSGMSVYSFLHYVTGKVQLNEALTSTRRHWSTICKKRLLTCLYIHFYMMSRANFSWLKNKEGIGHNLEEKIYMSVYSFLRYVTGKVQLNEALTSARRHWSTIWKKILLACLYIHFYIMSRAKFSWTRL